MVLHPLGQLVVTTHELAVDRLDAVHFPSSVGLFEPLPETGAEVETVVVVLGTNEYVGVKQIGHYSTPSCAPRPSKVVVFFTSSSRKASV